MYYPLNYDRVNWIEGHFAPRSIKINSAAFEYWCRSLYQRIISKFAFELPENWTGDIADFFRWCLFTKGFVLISEDSEHGYFFQPAAPQGYGFYYQPVRMIVSNPLMQRTFTIGKDCEVLKLTPDYYGVMDIVYRYAEQLATLDVAINTNIINSKLPYLAGAKTKAEAEALKTIMDRVNRGEPAVFYDKALQRKKPTDADDPFFVKPLQELRSNYIVSEQLKDSQTIINAFDAEVGIQTVPYQKGERMTAYESASKEQDSTARVTTWETSLRSSLAAIKRLYPDIRLDFSIRKGGADNGDRKDDTGLDGTVDD